MIKTRKKMAKGVQKCEANMLLINGTVHKKVKNHSAIWAPKKNKHNDEQDLARMHQRLGH